MRRNSPLELEALIMPVLVWFIVTLIVGIFIGVIVGAILSAAGYDAPRNP